MMNDLVIRKASIAPASIDAARRTVSVIWSTGARVLRGFFERFYEELSLDPQHVRMERLTSGNAPLLDAHNGYDTGAVVGVVESARLERGQGIATVRFAKDDAAADAVWNKVEQGILRNISVGYKVHRYDKVTGGEGTIPVLRATDWEPFEVSVVPMGADAGATFRAATHLTEEIAMEPTPETTTPTPADVERERCEGILRIVRAAKLKPELGEQLIRDQVTLDAARELILNRLADEDDKYVTISHGGAVERSWDAARGDGGADFMAAAIDGLLLRAGLPVPRPHAAARDLATSSVHEIARTCCSRAGIRHASLSVDRLLQRAMTTSEFPQILADGIGKAIRRGYEDEPSSHRAWVRPVPVRDFKTQLRPILGSAPDLELVLEHGEYREGNMDEDSTSYQVEKFGKIVAVTWEVLVNDDLSAFLRVQPALGQAARRKEADNVYALFALNAGAGPTMQDAVALFHATHANLGTAAAFDADALGAARTLLRKQVAVGGGFLSLVPRYLLVPAEREQQAEVLLAAATRAITTAPASDTVPGWIGDLRLVVEPRLADGAVYLAADSAQIDTVELGLLEENLAGPMILEEREFIMDVFRTKVRHVFAAKFLDWRGVVKQPVT